MGKIKFSTQLDAEILASTRELAAQEGRQIQALVEEALRDLIERRRTAKARPHVLAFHRESMAEFGALYEKLAK